MWAAGVRGSRLKSIRRRRRKKEKQKQIGRREEGEKRINEAKLKGGKRTSCAITLVAGSNVKQLIVLGRAVPTARHCDSQWLLSLRLYASSNYYINKYICIFIVYIYRGDPPLLDRIGCQVGAKRDDDSAGRVYSFATRFDGPANR